MRAIQCLRASTAVIALALIATPALAGQATAQPTQPASPPPAKDQKRDIVVTGNREVTTSIDRQSFSIANDLQAQTGSLADALRAVPGVEVDPQGQVSLRGDTGVTIMIDGRPAAMLNGESRGDVLLSMSAGQIERVEVINNPSAAMSPEGSGGVINLVRKQARKDSSTGTVKLTAGPKGRGSANLSGNHSAGPMTLSGELGYRRFTGNPQATQLRSAYDADSDTFVDSRLDGDIDNVFAMRTARVGADYDVNPNNRLNTEVNYRAMNIDSDRRDEFASDNNALSYDRDSDIAATNRGGGAKLGWIRKMGGEGHSLSADLIYDENHFRRKAMSETDLASASTSFEDIRNNADLRKYNAKLDYKRPLGKESTLNIGYEAEVANNAFDSTGDRGAALNALLPVAALTNRFEYDQTVHALYGVYEVTKGKLGIQSGLRLEQVYSDIDQITDDVQAENDYFRVYPTLHLNYDLGSGQQLRGSFSRRIQRPSPQDLNPYTVYIDPLNLRRGNPSLRPQVTDAFEASWQKRKAGTFYSVTAFYRRFKDGITDVIEDLGDGVFLNTRENLATADRVGLDLIANGRLGKTLTYNASGTVMWSKLDPMIDGVSSSRSGTTTSARGTLNWQPSPKDFVQINTNYPGKQLLPQGYRTPAPLLNLGYRRKVDEKLSLLATAQDVFASAKIETVVKTPLLRDRTSQTGFGRQILVGLSYNFGGRNPKQKEPSFDFQGPDGTGGAA